MDLIGMSNKELLDYYRSLCMAAGRADDVSDIKDKIALVDWEILKRMEGDENGRD